MYVACGSETVLAVFRVTGMTKVLRIFATRAEAVAAISEEGSPGE